jgi:glycerol-3-phosphate dehydrogenase (NAD(P)+)
MNEIAILGAGAWGTALALLAARRGLSPVLWTRDPAQAETLAATRVNPRLAAHPLPPAIRITARLEEAEARFMLLAVPVQSLRLLLPRLAGGSGALVLCGKGVDAESGLLPPELAARLLPHRPALVLSGPNFAHEIAAGLPAASVIAHPDAALRRAVMERLGGGAFRLYGNADVIGVALGGAAKNVIAIAAGAVSGAAWGENARAALITRGLAEMSRLAAALGGQAETMMGLAGLGDLVLTATGAASRNFRLGEALGRGETLSAAAAAIGSTIEGIATAAALERRAAALGVETPIVSAVSRVLAGETDLEGALKSLLERRPRDE